MGARRALYAPEPTQDIHCHNGNARTGGDAGERLFGAGFAVREAVPADHDRNQTCNPRDRAGKKALDGTMLHRLLLDRREIDLSK